MDMTPQAWPDWYDGRHINEVLFCQQFLDKHPMKCVRGRLFTVDGLIEDEGQIGNLILEEISGVLTSGLSKVVTNLLASIKLQAYSPPLPIETDRIHVANGTYFMDGSFTADKSYCNNRLTVAYNPDAPTPKRWLQFLSELLQPEDIPTLQEFLGYCLLPTTKGQKMLMLIGKGGEGKSRIGLVMRSLLGDSMNTTSIQKVESNRFSRADLENKLLMVDDDMDMSALPKTNYIKSIVTSECKMDMERKGVQSYQSQLYVRFLCFGNGALTALHDKSDGFFRRQIVLTTKDRPAGQSGRSVSGGQAAAGKGGYLPLVSGGAAPADWEQLSVQHFGQSQREYGDGQAQQQQCDRVSAIRGLYPLSGQTAKPAPRRSMKPIPAGATITRRSPCQPTVSAPSLHKMSGFTMWRPPTMSMSAVSGCGGLWALRWSIRRRIKNEELDFKIAVHAVHSVRLFLIPFSKTVFACAHREAFHGSV